MMQKTLYLIIKFALLVLLPVWLPVLSPVLSPCVRAQNVIDSLEHLLEKTELGKRPQLLNELANEYATFDNEKSLDYATEARELAVKQGDKKQEATAIYNIGYANQMNYELDQALDYYNQSLVIRRNIDDKDGISTSLRGVGIVYQKKREFTKALNALFESYEISNEADDKLNTSKTYNTIGNIYKEQENFSEAISYFKKASKLKQELNDKEGLGITYYNIGNSYLRMTDLTNASYYQNMALEIFESIDFKKGIISCLNGLGLVYEKMIENVKERTLGELEIRTDDTTAYDESLLYYERALKIAREINDIENQASLLHNIGTIYSHLMKYEKAEKYFQETLIARKEMGDMGEIAGVLNNIGTTYLNETVNEKGVTSPDRILDHMRENIIKALQQTGKEGEQKDGMDMAICTIDMKGNESEKYQSDKYNLLFSGANNPLYHIRDELITVVKGDKQPVSIHLKMSPFKLKKMVVEPGDIIYLFSDGFADQFGGKDGKKFKYGPFQKLLLEAKNLSMEDQKITINSSLEEWMSTPHPVTGNPYRQVDDICAVGVRF